LAKKVLMLSALVRDSHLAPPRRIPILFRLGAPEAITAVAHKLAPIVCRILKFGRDYYQQRYKDGVVRNRRTRARTLGYALQPFPRS
jgi:hypothetical protein